MHSQQASVQSQWQLFLNLPKFILHRCLVCFFSNCLSYCENPTFDYGFGPLLFLAKLDPPLVSFFPFKGVPSWGSRIPPFGHHSGLLVAGFFSLPPFFFRGIPFGGPFFLGGTPLFPFPPLGF